MVRLEMVEKVKWFGTVGEWMQGEGGRLLTKFGGKELGVWVGKGEAYGAALEEVERMAKE